MNTDWSQAGRFFCLGVGCAGAAGLAYEAYKRLSVPRKKEVS